MKVALLDMGYLANNNKETEIGIGPLIIANAFKKKHIEVHFIDKQDYALRANVHEVVDSVIKIQPEIIVFSTRCDNYALSIRIAKAIKIKNKKTLIIFGGPQATHSDLETIEYFQEVDLIIRGEGEETTLELIDAIENKSNFENIKGLTIRKNGSPYRTAKRNLISNFELLPYYDLIPSDFISNFKRGANTIRLEVGRGCPYSCTFCSTCNMWEKNFRLKEAKDVYNEMILINKKFGFNKFIFEHDSLTASYTKFKKFIEEFKDLNKKNFTWKCSSRIDTLKYELLDDMKQAGCESIYFGIESGSKKMQKLLNKNLDLSKIKKGLNEVHKRNLRFIASFVFAHPEEDVEDINKTLELAIHCAAYPNCTSIQLHKLSPVNGSQMFEEWKDSLEFDGLISDQAKCKLDTEDIALIKKHKNVFAAFYSFPSGKLDKEIIKLLCEEASDLINSYPRTLLFALKELSLKPLNIISELHKHKSILKGVEQLFNKRQKILPEYIIQTIKFEEKFLELNINRNEFQPNHTGIHKNPNLSILELSFNPLDPLNYTEIKYENIELMMWKKPKTSDIKFKVLDKKNKLIFSTLTNADYNSTDMNSYNFLINRLLEQGLLIKEQ